MTFILIAIACCLEICLKLDPAGYLMPVITGRLPLFVVELILFVACSVVASEKSGIEIIEQKHSTRFRANTVEEAKIISQARGGLRIRSYAGQADRGDFFPASCETDQTPLVFTIFTSGKRRI